MIATKEHLPLWSDAPRYCPGRPFPAYRFVPGLNPHPTGQVGGHSYGKSEEHPSYLPPNRWRENQLYLFGIDLYHQGYFWESHEAWETLWHLTKKEDGEGQFFQGLIQNAAAQLKIHLRSWEGARHLSQESFRRFQFVIKNGVCDAQGKFMGVDLLQFLKSMNCHYHPLWEGKDEVISPVPLLILEVPSLSK